MSLERILLFGVYHREISLVYALAANPGAAHSPPTARSSALLEYPPADLLVRLYMLAEDHTQTGMFGWVVRWLCMVLRALFGTPPAAQSVPGRSCRAVTYLTQLTCVSNVVQIWSRRFHGLLFGR